MSVICSSTGQAFYQIVYKNSCFNDLIIFHFRLSNSSKSLLLDVYDSLLSTSRTDTRSAINNFLTFKIFLDYISCLLSSMQSYKGKLMKVKSLLIVKHFRYLSCNFLFSNSLHHHHFLIGYVIRPHTIEFFCNRAPLYSSFHS